MNENETAFRPLRPEAEVSAEYVGRDFVIGGAARKYAGLNGRALRAIEHPAGFVMVEMGLEDGRVHWFGTSLFEAAHEAPTWNAEHQAQWIEAKRELAASGNDLAPWLEDWRAKHVEGIRAHDAFVARQQADAERSAAHRQRVEDHIRRQYQHKEAVRSAVHRLIKH